MDNIEALLEKMLDEDLTISADSIEKLIQMSSVGNEKATEFLYKNLNNYSSFSGMQKVFEKPMSSKCIICILDILSSLNINLLTLIINNAVSDPNKYSSNFKEMFVYFLKNSRKFDYSIIENIGNCWRGGGEIEGIPPNYKEAIRQYLNKEMENLYSEAKQTYPLCNSLISFPEKHPLLHWLEEVGAITYSHPSYSDLQSIAEGLGLHLKDTVVQIETADPSPITMERQKQERKEGEIELLPIDKLLGQYFPEDKRIVLYKLEVKLPIAAELRGIS